MHTRLTYFMFLCKCFNIVGRVWPHGQQTHHWWPWITLIPHFLKVKDDSFRIFFTKSVANVFSRLRECSIRTPGTNKKQTSENVKGVVVAVRNDFLFWRIFIKPLPPLFLITLNLCGEKYRNHGYKIKRLDMFLYHYMKVTSPVFLEPLSFSFPRDHFQYRF